MRWSFENLELQSIYAWIMEDNIPSQRAIAEADFQPGGRIRQATSSDGRPVDRLYYDIVPADLA